MIEPGGAPDAPVGRTTGAPFGPAGVPRWRNVPAEEPRPPWDEPAAHHVPAAARTGSGVVRVRPYVRTGGRTKSGTDLALETLVTVTVTGRPARLANREYRNVVDLCGVPRSIAEVAALSSMPVGVARVLVGDLAAQGLLTVHHTRGPAGGPADMALMRRVLSGLRRL